MYIIKVGELYVHYICIQSNTDNIDIIEEVLLRPHYARKFEKEEAEMIAQKLNGEVITVNKRNTKSLVK